MKVLVLAAAAVLLLPVACAAVITVPLAGRYIPQIPPQQVAMYRAAVAAVEQRIEDETTGDRPGITIPLPEMIAIDAVRFEQDFRRVTPAAAETLAWEFAERHTEDHYHCDPARLPPLPPIHGTVPPELIREFCDLHTHVWYTRRSLSQVLDRLAMTDEERGWVQDLLETLRRRPDILEV